MELEVIDPEELSICFGSYKGYFGPFSPIIRAEAVESVKRGLSECTLPRAPE